MINKIVFVLLLLGEMRESQPERDHSCILLFLCQSVGLLFQMHFILEGEAMNVERGEGGDGVEWKVGLPVEPTEPGNRNVYLTLGQRTTVVIGHLYPGRWHRAQPNPNYRISITTERLPDGRLKLDIVAYLGF